MYWFRFFAFRAGYRTGASYSLTQVVFSSGYLDASRVSIRTQFEFFNTSWNRNGGSIFRPVASWPCTPGGGLRSTDRLLVVVKASSASNTSAFSASFTAACSAALLAPVGFVMRAATSPPVAIDWQPASIISPPRKRVLNFLMYYCR